MKHLSLIDIKIDLPAIYVFSDSFVDNGNNKAILGNKDAIGGGYLPFGIDFDGKPTGRVTNGRIGVDFIATVAGLPYPPPIMGMSKIDRKRIQIGVNYASGSSGLLPQNGLFLHKNVINFFQQVDLFENTTMEDLKSSKFVLGDIYKVFQDVFEMPESYGFKDVNTSCCIDNNGTKIQVCALNIAPCKDRKTRVFFDPFHPSETMHFLWARRFLKDSSVCSPINLIQLMQA
ncbi:hypothetical protein Gohar_009931 [Gossypium harknessii]|uniref:Uncharacterized protein n=1 Tax=Gossypium harknessii TaxID=34285 RepID=A0A7J9GPF6_9ROSI|nr:hypothetical protein [Gossypium harknessii]